VNTPSRIRVNLPGREYDVLVGQQLLTNTGQYTAEIIPAGRKCALVTDTTVAPLYAQTVLDSLTAAGYPTDLITVPAGEQSKSMLLTESICSQMIQQNHDRNSFLIALGGGVIGDLAGFAASVFFRGIPYIQIPTTVVSQVDSSVGGKTGVNAAEGKNLIGAFHQPRLVIADTDTLATMEQRAFNEGFAEIIKHAAIRDASMFDEIKAVHGTRTGLAPLIEKNVRIKAAIVEEDEKETTGTRALLNFGHTIGHGIEATAGYGKMFHGEAISLGTIAAARLSIKHSTLTQPEASQIQSLLALYDLPLSLPDEIATDQIMEALSHDKKFRSGQITFILLSKLGTAHTTKKITLEDIRTEIEFLRT
jgi:3-dehydroquinate synthase